jgi:hypothetical protein
VPDTIAACRQNSWAFLSPPDMNSISQPSGILSAMNKCILVETLILTLAGWGSGVRDEGTITGGGWKQTYLLCIASVQNEFATSVPV